MRKNFRPRKTGRRAANVIPDESLRSPARRQCSGAGLWHKDLMHHEGYKELLALDAVGALTPEEARVLAGHTVACEECRREAAELSDAAAALAYGVAPVAPPPALRARVLESTRAAETVLPFKRPARDGYGDGPNALEPVPRAASPAPVSIGAWRLLSSRPPLMFGAIAAVLVIAVLGALSAALWARNRELTTELAQLSQSLNRARGELTLAREESVRLSEIRDVVTAPGAPVAALAGTEVAPGATARLVVDKRTGRAVFATEGLPPAPAGKAYQLWYIAGGKPQPGVVFKTDATGHAVVSDRVPAAGRDASVFAVTLEPEGGVSAPTGGMYLRGAAS